MTEPPDISSFVIRIIEEPSQKDTSATFRGVIRHVQSDQEISFINWSDVETFIQKFVPIHQMSQLNNNSRLPANPGGDQ